MIGHLPEVSLLEVLLHPDGDSPRAAEMADHLAGCARCQERLRELREDLCEVVSEQAPPRQPPKDLRSRLLASVGAESACAASAPDSLFAGFRDRFARLFALDGKTAQGVLALLQRDTAWELQGPISYFHFTPGAALAQQAEAGLVRLLPGVTFPLHRHRGDEYGLVLSGALREDLHGRVGFPGDLLHMPEGSTHTVTCVSKESCIFAVLLKGGMPLILSESAPLP